MPPTREDFVRIARDAIGTSECDNPLTFDPPEWALRAIERAYQRGRAAGQVAAAVALAPIASEGR